MGLSMKTGRETHEEEKYLSTTAQKNNHMHLLGEENQNIQEWASNKQEIRI